jgi:lactoylglutathione lyase
MIAPLMKVGRWLHTRLRVENLEKSVDFYRDVLGLKEVSRSTSPRGSTLVFLQPEAEGECLELCHYPKAGPVKVPADMMHLAFEVEDLEAFGRYTTAKGYPWSDGPTQTQDGEHFAFLDAPEGYEIEIMQKAKSK